MLAVILQRRRRQRHAVGCRGGDEFAKHQPARIQVVFVLNPASQFAIGGEVFFLEMQAGVVARA